MKKARAFWSWIWKLNEQRPAYQFPSGRLAPPSKRNLSAAIGLSIETLRVQSIKGQYPTVSQAHDLARVLGVSFAEIAKRAKLRPDTIPRKTGLQLNGPAAIKTCLSCPLPDCADGTKACPLAWGLHLAEDEERN